MINGWKFIFQNRNSLGLLLLTLMLFPCLCYMHCFFVFSFSALVQGLMPHSIFFCPYSNTLSTNIYLRNSLHLRLLHLFWSPINRTIIVRDRHSAFPFRSSLWSVCILINLTLRPHQIISIVVHIKILFLIFLCECELLWDFGIGPMWGDSYY